MSSLRKPINEIHHTLKEILLQYAFEEKDADLSARLFTETTRDGVYSHGLNRFPRYIEYVEKGYVHPDQKAEEVEAFGNFKVFDGHLGPGNINAWHCMDTAIGMAKTNTVGMVAIRNNNHWLRGGAYGWQAAENGCAAICFTNTTPNMPAWGTAEPVVGNNPLIMAMPDPIGHVVLDMAMSQFAFGKLEVLQQEGRRTPYPAGFDEKGNLSDDPATVRNTKLALPAGYWKGSGLSMMLDLFASVLSNGRSTQDIGQLENEYGLSQCFIAIDLEKPNRTGVAERMVTQLKQAIKDAKIMEGHHGAYYPGEKTLKTRKENTDKGIPVPEELWEKILHLKK